MEYLAPRPLLTPTFEDRPKQIDAISKILRLIFDKLLSTGYFPELARVTRYC